MRKIVQTIALAALCLNFSLKAQEPVANTATAQQPGNKPIDVTSKGIQIGQKIPAIRSLSPHKGKFIIMDFWATWCSPCVAMIPKMEALQQQFKDQLQIVPVTYQSEQEVNSFLDKLNKGKPSSLPHITADKELRQLFPHIYLPHYVWIDKDGTVEAITGYQEVTAANIQKVLDAGNTSVLKQKQDIKSTYDSKIPLVAAGNAFDDQQPLFQSTLLPYNEQIHGGYRLSPMPGYHRVTALNCAIQTLYQIAFGEAKAFFGNSKTIVEVQDPEPVTYTKKDGRIGEWLRAGNGYCYELLVDSNHTGNYFDLMKQDLQRFFPKYTARLEKRKALCYVLVRTSKEDKIRSKGGKYISRFDATGCQMQNMNLQRLIARLEAYYMPHTTYPLVNESGYTDPVDLIINAPLNNMNAINLELAKYDLQFIGAERQVEMLVISDNLKYSNLLNQPKQL